MDILATTSSPMSFLAQLEAEHRINWKCAKRAWPVR
jgi:hypothetical protein